MYKFPNKMHKNNSNKQTMKSRKTSALKPSHFPSVQKEAKTTAKSVKVFFSHLMSCFLRNRQWACADCFQTDFFKSDAITCYVAVGNYYTSSLSFVENFNPVPTAVHHESEAITSQKQNYRPVRTETLETAGKLSHTCNCSDWMLTARGPAGLWSRGWLPTPR